MKQFSTGDRPLCTRCQHTRDKHKTGGLCTGLGDEAGMVGRFCHCASYEGSREGEWSEKGHYGDYVPPPRQQRTGFSSTSSQRELGGRGAARPNLQNKRTVGGANPDWAMFGVSTSYGVRLYASTELSYLELRQEVGYFDELHGEDIADNRITSTPWDINGRMVSYVVIDAASYAEAIQRLFRHGWSPDGDTGPSTGELQRAAAIRDAEVAAAQAERDRLARLAIEGMVAVPDDDVIDAEVIEDE